MNFRYLLLLLTLPLYALDQATKFWTVAHFADPLPGRFSTMDPMIEVIAGFFYLTRVHNQGVAFGFGNGTPWAPIVFLLVPIFALSIIRFFWKKGAFCHPLSKTAVALLLTGIFGNLTDRLVQGFLLAEFKSASAWQRLTEGYVVDFISLKLPLYDKIVPTSHGWWPSFNVADSCICVAAFLLFIGGMIEEAQARKVQAAPPVA